jgi:hypothetical protein
MSHNIETVWECKDVWIWKYVNGNFHWGSKTPQYNSVESILLNFQEEFSNGLASLKQAVICISAAKKDYYYETDAVKRYSSLMELEQVQAEQSFRRFQNIG